MAMLLGNGILYFTNAFGLLGIIPTFIVGLVGDILLLIGVLFGFLRMMMNGDFFGFIYYDIRKLVIQLVVTTAMMLSQWVPLLNLFTGFVLVVINSFNLSVFS